MGDDLNPAEITRLLGHEPTNAETKGQEIVGIVTGNIRIARSGSWQLDAKKQSPGDLDAQIGEILSKLTDNLSIWRNLAGKYRMDLFCGLFLEGVNEGVSISAESLASLGNRGIEIGLDIYAGDTSDT